MNTSPLILDENINIEEVVKEATTTIPRDYIPVKLQTLGMLEIPAEFHMRDYTMEDILQLNIQNEDQFVPNVVSIFNTMIWEKNVDCANMHVNEFIETLYTLYGSFIGSTVEKEYYIDDSLPEGVEEGQIDHLSNIATEDIPISKIQIQALNTDEQGFAKEVLFKEPFNIKDVRTGRVIKLRLSKLKDLIFAQKYCEKKFAPSLKKFAQFKYNLNQLKSKKESIQREELDKLIRGDLETYNQYADFMQEYDAEFLRIIQAQTILAIDGKELESIEKKIEAYKNKVSAVVWATYNDVVSEYKFGLKEEVTFYSETLQKEITRKFQFQFIDFLPDSTKPDSGRAIVSFD